MAANNMTMVNKTSLIGDSTDNAFALIRAFTDMPVVLRDIWVSMDGQSNTEQGVEWFIQPASTDGTGTSFSTQEMLDQRIAHTMKATIIVAPFTAEPTKSGNRLWSYRMHPQGGVWKPPHFERPIIIPGGSRMVLWYNAADAHEGIVTIEFEE